jgi:polysaccharide deacetylase 2 family uncharacterized protein YibQ
MTAEEGMAGGRKALGALALAWAIALLALLCLAGAVALFGNPRAGAPAIKLDLKLQPAHKTAQRQANTNVNLIGAGPQPIEPMPIAPSAPMSAVPAPAPGVTQTPPAPKSAPTVLPPQIVPAQIGKAVYAGRALVADPALIEQSTKGPLPRIADDGRTPLAAYAPPVVAAPGQPKIAIVVGGLGISARQTAAAIAQLPGGITLAFAPYDNDVQRWISEARKQGHEVLLEVPMEPYDFPDSDPGPHTLRATASEDTNIERLSWSLSRVTGYVGITNLLGGRFITDADALEPVMTDLARRGLMFFDNGSSLRSVAPDVAKRVGAPFAQAATTIDVIQTGMEIDQRLSELETRARLNGWAAGSAFLYPVTLDRLSVWAKGLPDRGLALVPASAIVAPPK